MHESVTPIAFLSSFTSEFGGFCEDGCVNEKGLRYQAWSENSGQLWVAECSDKSLIGRKPGEIMDRLLQQIRNTELVICLLAGNRRGSNETGSPIAVDDRPSVVSHFEAELFMASVLDKKIEVFVAKEFDPGPRLTNLLKMLKNTLPESRWHQNQSESQILLGIQSLIGEYFVDKGELRRRKNIFLNTRSRQRLLANAFAERGMPDHRPPGAREILFLNHEFESSNSSPDKDLVELLLDEAQDLEHADFKLGRLWLAIRELMKIPPELDKSADFFELWDKALTQWCKHAGWYGLHGYSYLGFSAAAYSLGRVRSLMRESRQWKGDGEILHPGGAIASSLYSTAKLVFNPVKRYQILSEGMAHLDKSRQETGYITTSMAHMLGNYSLMLARPFEALKYLEMAVDSAERGDGDLGVSFSELGYAYFVTGRIVKGLELMKKGTDLLAASSGDSGFYARALRKLAFGYKFTGQFELARESRRLQLPLIERRGFYDQQR